MECKLVFKTASMKTIPNTLTIHSLLEGYRDRSFSPVDVLTEAVARIRRDSPSEIWITLADEEAAIARARGLGDTLAQDAEAALSAYPLLGIPFAVKDNIDVADLPTTAACPSYAFSPQRSAEVVERLQRAGAIVVGKTNLDQFATGLVGTRSPYGAVKNPFNPEYISGGSSSGSAAAVALGFAAFSLGTDTAGSGRVPAGFCNLVGIKPTPGLISTRGVLPACRSLDCVSVFAHCVGDGWRVLSVLAGVDPDDTYSRYVQPLAPLTREMRVGVPVRPEFFGDAHAEAAFEKALATVRGLPNVRVVPIDFAPLHGIAELLYDGPWVAERRAALGDFFDMRGADMDATVHSVIARADGKSAVEAFRGLYKLEAGKRMAEAMFTQVDMLLVPTAPTHYTVAQIAEEPATRNSHLGTYTNFVNLLGMSALALPAGFRDDGLPAGITFIGAGGADHRLAEFARSIEPLLHRRLGRSHDEPPRCADLMPLPNAEPKVSVALVGAHLSGQPLNWQLVERGARLVRTTHTAPQYRLYALPGTTPPKPGLIRAAGAGAAIEVEIWEMPLRHYGSFVSAIPAPLGIGSLTLKDGSTVQGFLCEAWAVAGARDISEFGGWRAYRAATAQTPPFHALTKEPA
jgi:allophanate hydrolase